MWQCLNKSMTHTGAIKVLPYFLCHFLMFAFNPQLLSLYVRVMKTILFKWTKLWKKHSPVNSNDSRCWNLSHDLKQIKNVICFNVWHRLFVELLELSFLRKVKVTALYTIYITSRLSYSYITQILTGFFKLSYDALASFISS